MLGFCIAIRYTCSRPAHTPLHTGRALIAQGGVNGQMLGFCIAIRYACSRPQFGDKVIMEYLTHKNRLLPALASTYALQLAMRTLKVCGMHWSVHTLVCFNARHVFCFCCSALKAQTSDGVPALSYKLSFHAPPGDPTAHAQGSSSVSITVTLLLLAVEDDRQQQP